MIDREGVDGSDLDFCPDFQGKIQIPSRRCVMSVGGDSEMRYKWWKFISKTEFKDGKSGP